MQRMFSIKVFSFFTKIWTINSLVYDNLWNFFYFVENFGSFSSLEHLRIISFALLYMQNMKNFLNLIFDQENGFPWEIESFASIEEMHESVEVFKLMVKKVTISKNIKLNFVVSNLIYIKNWMFETFCTLKSLQILNVKVINESSHTDSFAPVPDSGISQVLSWSIKESRIQFIYFYHFLN